MKSRFPFVVSTLFFLLYAASALATGPAPAEHLPTLIATALANNPELKSSRARWQIFVNKARQAAALEDPMIMFKLQNLVAREPLSFGGSDPQTAKVVGISQQLPFWGKRALRQEMADYEAHSASWLIEERRLELTRMVKETYYQLYGVDRSLALVERNLQSLAEFITIAESKYAVGQGVQQDIYRAGLEKARMLEMQISLRQQRQSLAANLNYLLDRPDATMVGPIADFQLPALPHAAPQLKEMANERRPQVKSLINLANKGEAARRLAQKESYPDFNLSFEYMFREAVANGMANDPGDNMFTVGVTFNLPLQRERRQAMAAEASSEANMAQEELHALNNSIGYAVNDLLAQLERRRQLVELYRSGIIPQAEQSLESAVISYRVGKVDFLTLLDGRMNLFNYERELYDSQAEYMMKLAQLEAVVGVEFAPPPSPSITH